ncbi:hypothetical protein, partial [Victivallis vadensis]|uniref:hypothetical protein n=1 Tax=Victivallis vadensis TaxID=172901 RepID=UPI0026738923
IAPYGPQPYASANSATRAHSFSEPHLSARTGHNIFALARFANPKTNFFAEKQQKTAFPD